MPLRYLFVDLNSYFASVEQQLRPELRAKPVAVVPMNIDTTVCIAASYEAKKFGIKTGTKVGEAKERCRDLILVEARPALYVEFHHKLVQAVESCIPIEKVFSIDEMVCRLTGSQQQRDRALGLAAQIKRKVAEDVGSELRSSIGIAPNVFLAKTASDMQKPDGLVVIDLPDLPECLLKLKLSDLYGIGPRMEKRLHENGIHTVRDLWNAGNARLRKVWGGIEGERMHSNLRGEDLYAAPTHKSSVGHSHVLEPDMRSEERAFAVLHRLLQKAAVRLRSYGLVAGALQVTVKYVRGARWEDEIHFDETSDTLTLVRALSGMWEKKPKFGDIPFKVAITLIKLRESQTQTLPLFRGKNVETLNAAIDKLNSAYGKTTVYYAGAHPALHSAPMRIAFGHIPDPDVEGDE